MDVIVLCCSIVVDDFHLFLNSLLIELELFPKQNCTFHNLNQLGTRERAGPGMLSKRTIMHSV